MIMNIIINFLKKEYKSIIGFSFILYVFYWITFVLTPTIEMSENEKQKIDSLNTLIKEIHTEQEKLDDKIDNINKKIKDVDISIDKVKRQKVIIKETYHEKINRVSNFTEPEIDSFLSERYLNNQQKPLKYLISKDLVKGDSAIAELINCNEHNNNLEEKVLLKDSVIFTMQEKEKNYKKNIFANEEKFNVLELHTKSVEMKLKKEKLKGKFKSFIGGGLILVLSGIIIF